MFIYHFSSACDVCLQAYTEDAPVAKQPHVIPCCHIFCKGCLETILDTTTDSQSRGRCPLCRHFFAPAGIKKLHVDAPTLTHEQEDQALLRLVLDKWDSEGEDLASLITQVDSWLVGKDENLYQGLRKARKALAQREEMQSQILENRHTIRSYKRLLKSAQNSALEEQEVSMAKEVSAQELQNRLDRSRVEIQELRDYIALLEGGRSHHRDKGKGRAMPLLDPTFQTSRARNPLPAPPQHIASNNYYLNTPPIIEDNDLELATAIEESLRYQQPQYVQQSGSTAGPSRIPAIGTSYTVANDPAVAPYPVAVHFADGSTTGHHSEVHPQRNSYSRGSRSDYPRYQSTSTPSPPRRTMMPSGPPETDRVAPDAYYGPSNPPISEQDLLALRKSVEDMNLRQAESSNRTSQADPRRHRRKDDRTRNDWAREATRQDQIRGVTGLGLINENVDEAWPQIQQPHLNVAPQPLFQQEVIEHSFEFPSARAVSATAPATSRARITQTHDSAASLDTQMRQVFVQLNPPRHQALARDSDGQSLLSNDTTGTWHSDQVGERIQRRSMNSDILNSLTTFPSPSDRRSSISSIVSLQNSFLPPIPPQPSRGSNVSLIHSRAGDTNTSLSSASGAPAGSATTTLGFFTPETPRPGNASTTTGHTHFTQPARESGGGRPRPSRHLTQPIPVRTDIHMLRGSGTIPIATIAHGQSSRAVQPPTTYTPIPSDVSDGNDRQPMPTEFGNALGLDLSRDLGSVAQQGTALANPQLLAPTPRAPHHQFLRSFSDGL
ncbi:hypothetical protein E1B28_006020 [Marasmius oreades]|uniref:RING-type domain-containing protein n=1 Tax=Marasmius oreades TaxID=181124 RepID=A0A9P7S4B7_9AGAR|nr:uncharacterized protein E1B28_006020 [Marasmius oreades]KAG7095246.1 hypothetical protein E1B28_006020 [Marasmius oreades]